MWTHLLPGVSGVSTQPVDWQGQGPGRQKPVPTSSTLSGAILVLSTEPPSPGAELRGQLLSAQGVDRGRRHLAWVGSSFKEVGPVEHS